MNTIDFLHGEDWFPDDNLPIAVYQGHHIDEFPLHVHDFTELVIVISGGAYHRVRDERYWIYPGNVFVVKNMVPHGYEEAQDLRIAQIVMNDTLLLEHFPEIQLMEGFQTLFYLQPDAEANLSFESRMCLDEQLLSSIDKQIQALDHELVYRKPGYVTMVFSMIGSILVQLCRYYSSTGPFNNTSHAGIAAATSYIYHNYYKCISISELCDAACMSCRSLNRHFINTVGIPPISYLNRVRVERAAALIRTTDLRIIDISEKVGFCDSNYFSRVFRNIYKMSPREYAHERNKNAINSADTDSPQFVRLYP